MSNYHDVALMWHPVLCTRLQSGYGRQGSPTNRTPITFLFYALLENENFSPAMLFILTKINLLQKKRITDIAASEFVSIQKKIIYKSVKRTPGLLLGLWL